MSNYEFSLRQEVLLEKGADILGSLFHFARNNHISPSDKKDPVNVVYGLVWNAKSSILGADTEAELDRKRSLILLVSFTLVLRREQNGH